MNEEIEVGDHVLLELPKKGRPTRVWARRHWVVEKIYDSAEPGGETVKRAHLKSGMTGTRKFGVQIAHMKLFQKGTP